MNVIFASPDIPYLGASTNGKSGDFGSPMWRFESSRPSQDVFVARNEEIRE